MRPFWLDFLYFVAASTAILVYINLIGA